ncbi:IS630 family transposase [Pseudanabaena sp. PCC 6802]|uniref:IS630 family transposase n=1 Tax=Pseudanabaena sp. PCC 6802 TaxID=118173 RepID=UPI0003454714|nr:IS630 family transposase [Pseudanabaena sp. PCC 6802]
MDKPDGRHLSIETQNYLRQQAIRLREQGKRVCDISEYLGIHRNTITEWWWAYQDYGEAALFQQRRGREVGEGRSLSASEETTIEAMLRGHSPEDYQIESALWTRQAVQILIEQELGVEMPIRTVGEYLKRWGYSPQKPIERAYEQDPAAVKHWLQEEYPAIEQRAQAEGAEIEWGDESGLSSDEYGGRGYAPKGHPPEIRPSKRERTRLNFIASISNQGTIQFMLYTCTLTAPVFIEFLQRLIDKRSSKLFWIVDRHPVHRERPVQQWLEQHSQEIELFYLPSYAPQLNPVEYFNGDVKQGVHAKPLTRNLGQLKHRLLSQLQKLQRLPAHIRSYFKHPSIIYAAL